VSWRREQNNFSPYNSLYCSMKYECEKERKEREGSVFTNKKKEEKAC
jgi:hypothetical protein